MSGMENLPTWTAHLILHSGKPRARRPAWMQHGNWSCTLRGWKEKMFINSDFSDLLRIFNDNRVHYLVIGGYAVIQYGEPRFTKDLDIWISTGKRNAAAVYRSLKQFGAPLENLSAKDFTCEGFFYQMGVPPIRIDIFMGVPGLDFQTAWTNRCDFVFDDLAVPFISKSDLITIKKAAGRPQDLLDASHLSE